MSKLIETAETAARDHTVAAEVAKMSPPASVAGLALSGVSLSDWLIVATLIYTALNIYFLLRDKWWRQRKRK